MRRKRAKFRPGSLCTELPSHTLSMVSRGCRLRRPTTKRRTSRPRRSLWYRKSCRPSTSRKPEPKQKTMLDQMNYRKGRNNFSRLDCSLREYGLCVAKDEEKDIGQVISQVTLWFLCFQVDIQGGSFIDRNWCAGQEDKETGHVELWHGGRTLRDYAVGGGIFIDSNEDLIWWLITGVRGKQIESQLRANW